MKITYDPDTDILNLIFRTGRIVESDEDKPGVILDYDSKGRILSMEVLDASKTVNQPMGISFELLGKAHL